ncbi:MAG TPA: peptide synthetase, partial [Desulfobulbaceae bacterium]|nr:peptide synthetase [Desulfobulbaceae bacterium]
QSIQRVTDSKVWVCGVAQLLLLTLITALYALPGLAILDWMAGHVNWTRPDYLQIGDLSSLAIVLSLVFSLAVPVVMKWVLLGRVKPGIYPLWGWFFLRFWLVDKMAAMAPLAFFSGTPMLSAYYRLLGARIGKNVILASPLLHLPDLVIIGHGTAINTGSHIFCYHVQNNRLHIAPVHIGKDCVIGSSSVLMPGAQMEDAAVLGDQSLLGTEERIPANGVWRGSPARLDARAGNRKNSLSEVGLGRPGQWLYFCCGILLFSLVPLAASFPAIVGVLAGYQIFGDYGLLVSAPFAGLSFVFCLHGLIVLLKKVVLPATSSGRYPVASLLYIRKWFVDRLMELSLGMSNSLYATLYLSPFLRLMGAKIGRLAEISTISHITPDLLEIGDESFVADIAHVGPTVVANGLFTLAPVRIGRRSFIGNAALVPGGTTVGKNALIGVLSVPPGSEVPAETTWLGSPPLHLPEREQSKFFPEHFTFAPTRNLYIRRLCYEYFRVTLPATLAFIGVTVLGQFALHLLAGFSLMAAALLLALAAVVMGVCLTAVVAGLKWLLIGTYRPRIRPMWSAFVWRSELITALYENVVVTWLLARLTGTPFMALVLRLFGVKIGSRCFLETTFMTEFDLVEIGDDCCIGLACSLQTHLFEDRVMKMSRLRIGDSCSIGPRAVILYDAILEQEVTLDALSLVMKGETLAAATCWHGSPARNR